MKKLLIIISISLVLNSCNFNPDREDNGIQEVNFRFDWFTNMSFAGEIWASSEFDEENNIELTLRPGSENLDPVKLILSGSDDFGIISADKFLIAKDKGADLIAIGVLNKFSPTVFISLKNKNIQSPKDFEDKIVGILPGGSTEYIYRTLISQANVDESKIQEKIAPFDLQTFISGYYDVRPAFIYDEPVFLDNKLIEYNIIEPQDYGVEFLGRVYFTRAELIKENPEMVQAFINSIAKGWEKSINNPVEAIRHLKEFDSNINDSTELASLRKGIEYFEGDKGKILFADMSKWEGTYNALKDLGIIKNTVDINEIVNYTFIEYYHKNKNVDTD